MEYYTVSQISRSKEAKPNWGCTLRESDRSFTGCVLDFWFPLEKEARAMAGHWSSAIGVSVKVRRDSGDLLRVSIPVQKPSY